MPAGRRANCLDIRGQAQRALGMPLEAIESFKAGLALDRRHVGLHNNLGIALQEEGRAGEAIACFERASELDPNRTEVHINLGNALRKAGRLRRALASYRRALAISPRSAFTLNTRGGAPRDRRGVPGRT